MQILSKITMLFGLLMLMGCINKRDDMVREIDINKFPVKLDLKNADVSMPSISSVGITEIKVIDSLLIVSVLGDKNFWHIYSTNSLDSIGRYLNVGNGPYELTMPVPCFQASFYHDDKNDLITCVPLTERQQIMEINLSKLTRDNNYEKSTRILDVQSNRMTLWTYNLDSSRYLRADIKPENKQIVRSIRNIASQSDISPVNKFLDILNSRKVESMEEIQLLLTTPAIRPKGDKVAEISDYNNQIIIYDTSDEGGVCIEYKNISKDKMNQQAQKNLSLFGGGYGYNNYFAIIRNIIDNGIIVNQFIDFLSWDGQPLGTVNLGKNSIRRFDIDETSGNLYCLDANADTISIHNIKSFLEEIKNICHHLP